MNVLLGIPVKNCGKYISNLCDQILHQTQPKEQLSVVFLVNDSVDDSWEQVTAAAGALVNAGLRRVVVEGMNLGFHLQHASRHLEEVQKKRISCLSTVRQHIADQYLSDHDYLYWVDADFEYIPPDAVALMASYQQPAVIPIHRLPSGAIYDIGTGRWDEKNDRLITADVLERTYTGTLVEIDDMSAAAFLSARTVRQVNYTQTTIGEQEGAAIARQLTDCHIPMYLARNITVIHAAVDGTLPLK